MLAEYFFANHNAHNRPNAFDRKTEREYRNILNSNTIGPADSFTVAETFNVILSARNKKSPGLDGVSNVMMKQAPTEVIEKLTEIFNRCTQIGFWP